MIELKYGEGTKDFTIEDSRVSGILVPEEKEGLRNPGAEISRSLEEPVKNSPLAEIIKQRSPDKVVIIVNDVSRPTPYDLLLPSVLDKLHDAGVKKTQITFIIATGIHARQSDNQSRRFYGDKIWKNYKFEHHNPDKNLIDMGKLNSGNRLYINRKIQEADFVLTTGVILPHYFAGFSGGRKSILPGVAGRESIEKNHAWMMRLMGDLPPIEENPISREMIAAVRRVGVDFILNVVTNSKREIVRVVAGDPVEAWYNGIDIAREMYYVDLDKKADVAIVSPGGYPRDINVYQSQKALEHADRVTKPGGVIILIAECREGLGDEEFARWIWESSKPEDNIERIDRKFIIGGHKAFAISKVARKKEIILISELDEKITRNLFARKMGGPEKAISYIEEKYNNDYSAVIIPHGSLTVPISTR